MRDWLVVLLILLAGLGAGAWALRPASRARSGSGAPQPVGSEASAKAEARPVKAEEVTNTRILPHPEDMPLATLEFESPVGYVAIRRGEVVIGRHSSDDVRIPDVRVSRHHARLVALGDGGFEIHNLTAVRSEPNPMLVNGVDREHARIDDGDVISLGGVTFTFRQAVT
jgi:hypothetical protein